MTTTTRTPESMPPTLMMAMELSRRDWKLAFATMASDRPRYRTVSAATGLAALPHELAQAKRHFGLPADARVVSCHEMGLDGFWIHRALASLGVENLPVDAAAIEVNRRARRAKSDGLDVTSLVRQLRRYLGGERKALAVVRVPTVAQEDGRQLHRALTTWKADRTRVRNRMRGLLASHGVRLPRQGELPAALAEIRLWDQQPLPAGLRARLERDAALLQTIDAQIAAAEADRRTALRPTPPTPAAADVQQLTQLRGLGETGAWVLVQEGLRWRGFRNRREVGAFVGVTPTPFQSGGSAREQGISKAGNARLRTLLNELSWSWVRYQPQSAITRWFTRRFAAGGGRARRIGIVAVARKLLIALWRYLVDGVLPEGAVLKPAA